MSDTSTVAVPPVYDHHVKSLSGGPVLVVVATIVSLNALAWAAFRIDKRRAERGRRRIRESTLLALAALGGGPGALLAMYGHHRRHKVAKRGFSAVVWLAALAQVALGAWLAMVKR